MEDKSIMFAIDLPDWGDIYSPWKEIETFDSKEDAIDFAKKTLGADDEGTICIISKLPADELGVDDDD